MSVIIVDKNNYEALKTGEKRLLLDFYADWCGPCRMLGPVIEQIANENPQYAIGKVNVDKEPELAQAFGVASIPTLVVIEKGKIINRATGAMPKAQILKLLEG